LLGSVGDTLLSGLSFVGNVLDTPGAIIRNTLAGTNPLQGLFDFDERTSGRQLLETWGVLAPNQEGPDAGDVAGFGAEILFDPLTYLTGGLTAAGKVAKKSGALRHLDIIKGAAKGKRQTRMNTTLGDLFGEQWFKDANLAEATRQAAEKSGVKLSDIIDQPLAGGIGLRIPFTGIETTFSGPLAQKWASFWDSVGSAIRNSDLLAPAAKLVSAGRRGANTGFGAVLGKSITEGRLPSMAEGRRVFAELDRAIAEWRPELLDDSVAARAEKYRLVEAGNLANMPPNVANAVREARNVINTIFDETLQRGAKGAKIAQMERGEHFWPRSMGASFIDETLQRTPSLRTVAAHRLIPLFSDPDVLRIATSDADGRTKLAQLKDILPTKMRQLGIEETFVPMNTPTQARLEAEKIYRMARSRRGRLDAMNMYGAWLEPLITARMPKLEFLNAVEQALIQISPSLNRPSKVINRVEDFAKLILETAEKPGGDRILAQGLYTADPLTEAMRYTTGKRHKAWMLDRMTDALSDPDLLKMAERLGGEQISLGDFFRDWSKIDRTRVLQVIAAKLGLDPDSQDAMRLVAGMTIPKVAADDIKQVFTGWTSKEVREPVLKWLDNFTTFFKGWVLAWPSYHIRNLISGAFANAQAGMFSPRDWGDVSKVLLSGKPVKGLKEVPVIKQRLLKRFGPDLSKVTDEQATREFLQLAFEYDVLPKQAGEYAEIAPGVRKPPTAREVASQAPSRVGLEAITDPLLKPKAEGTSYNWRDLLLGMRGLGGRDVSTNPWIRSHEAVGYITEGFNRLGAFLNQLRKGVGPEEAVRRVLEVQIDYASHNFTPFERNVLLRVFPFGRFTKGMMRYVPKKLAEDPAGLMGQSIRAARLSQSQMPGLPDHIRQGLAIPVGQDEEGNPQFVTASGLMHEDPLGFFSGARHGLDLPGLVRGGTLEVISRANPLIKAPIEWGMGSSAFQAGASGGRDLRDMDPTIGRIVQNITGEEGPPMRLGFLDHLAANLPTSRAMTMLRTMTDTRKNVPEKLINLLTGVRISSLSPAAQDAEFRENIEDLLRDFPQTRAFERVYIPQEELEKMSPEEQQRAIYLQTLLKILGERAKRRAEAREAA